MRPRIAFVAVSNANDRREFLGRRHRRHLAELEMVTLDRQDADATKSRIHGHRENRYYF